MEVGFSVDLQVAIAAFVLTAGMFYCIYRKRKMPRRSFNFKTTLAALRFLGFLNAYNVDAQNFFHQMDQEDLLLNTNPQANSDESNCKTNAGTNEQWMSNAIHIDDSTRFKLAKKTK